jgi:hypothetical protein
MSGSLAPGGPTTPSLRFFELAFLQVAEIRDFFLSRGDNNHHAFIEDRNRTRGAGRGEVAADHREIDIAAFKRAGGLDGTIHRLNGQMNFCSDVG